MSANPRASQSLVMTPAAAAAQSEMPHGFIEMLLGFAKLLETGQGSDMTITCKAKVFKIHSAIVPTSSQGPAGSGESTASTLPDDDPAAVGAMLQYLYTLKYPNDVHDDCFYDNSEEQFLTGSDQ
ncbi:hypothetical protein BDR22DRAFT_885599 [Usnea florida]